MTTDTTTDKIFLEGKEGNEIEKSLEFHKSQLTREGAFLVPRSFQPSPAPSPPTSSPRCPLLTVRSPPSPRPSHQRSTTTSPHRARPQGVASAICTKKAPSRLKHLNTQQHAASIHDGIELRTPDTQVTQHARPQSLPWWYPAHA